MAKNPFSNTTNKKTSTDDSLFQAVLDRSYQRSIESRRTSSPAPSTPYQSKVETAPTAPSAVGGSAQTTTPAVNASTRKNQIEARLKQIESEYRTAATVLSGYQRGGLQKSNAYLTAKEKADSLKAEKSELEKELQSVYDQMASDEGYREANFIDNTWNSLKRGWNNSRFGEESFDEMQGRENEKQKYKDILAGEDYAFVPSNMFEKAVSGTMEQMGQMARQTLNERTLSLGIAGMGTGYAVGTVAGGGLGSLITAPAGATAGMTSGLMTGNVMSNFEIEAGLAYDEMLENGVSPETAKKVAQAVGGVNAALELIPMDELVKTYKILKSNPATVAAADTLSKRLLDVGVVLAKSVGKETAQEVAQEATTIHGVQQATKMDTGKKAYTGEEIGDRLVDTAISSALTFGLMNVPNAVVGTRNAVHADRVGSTYNADVNALIEEGFQSDPNSESYEIASKLKTRLDNGGTVSNTEAYDLAAANAKAIDTENKLRVANNPPQTVESSVETAPVQSRVSTTQTRLAESGMEATKAETAAKSINRILSGDTTITNKDKDVLSVGNAVARAIFEEETGVKLPASNSSTRKTISEYVAQTALKQQKQESTATVAENETVAQTPAQLKNNAPTEAAPVKNIFTDYQNWQTAQKHDVAAATMETVGATGQKVYSQYLPNAENVPTYTRVFQRYYDAGRINYPLAKMDSKYGEGVEPKMLVEAYKAGTEDASVAGESKPTIEIKNAQKGEKTPSKRKGEFKDKRKDKTTNPISKETYVAIKKFARSFNVDIKLVDRITDKNGNPVAANGYYDRTRREIVLAADSDNALMLVLKHEVTHHIQKVAPEQYKAYKDYVMKAFYENSEDVMNAEIQLRIDLARKNNIKLTRDGAMDEIVADATEKFLTDRDSIDALVRENRSLAETILNAIRDALRKIEAAMKGVEVKGLHSNFMNADQLKTAEKMWVEALAGVAMEDGVGIQYDSTSESVAPVWSLKTWNESEYVKAREESAKAMAKQLGVTKEQALAYIDNINSIARLIADDRVRLDYESNMDAGATVLKPNSEYKYTVDMSTLCAKRLLFTGTFDAIQKALPNTVFDSEDIVRLRKMMMDRDLQVACGICYVESTRREIGRITQDFIDRYKEAQKTGKPITRLNSEGKSVDLKKTKDQMATTVDKSTDKFFADKDYTPTLADLNTTDIDIVKRDHPLVYEAYLNFMNARGQAKPKLLETRAEYKGEILKHFKVKSAVKSRNEHGGLRLQSFSDFEVPHMIDMMQVVTDMSRVGLKSQAYTKVPAFAAVFGDTGVKINLSLIAKGDGLDANGNLIFDDVEGIDHKEAFRLRDQYSKNVGTILVGKSDAHIIAAMADPRIDFIIPFHKSSWKESLYDALGLTGYDDYTDTQNEKPIDKDRTISNFDPSEYWDFSKTGDENAQIYLEKCREDGRTPKFPQFQGYSGYWKLLIDFKMYDNDGVGSPQTVVRPDFNMDAANKILNDYEGGHRSFPVAQDVVDEFVSEYKAQKNTTDDGGVQYMLKGVNSLGIEVYETSDEVMNMSVAERKKEYLRIMSNEYAGRTARFVRNGHTYYAEFDRKSLSKPMYGDNRSSPSGQKALIRAGADGDIFDLVENSKYTHSSPDRKNHKDTDYFDYFIKTVQIDGKVYDLFADVKKQFYKGTQGYVYTLVLRDNKKIKAHPAGVSTSAALNVAGRTLTSGNSMTQPEDSVKHEDGQYQLKTPDDMLDLATEMRHKAKAVTDAEIMSQAVKDLKLTTEERTVIRNYQNAMKTLADYEQKLAVYEATKAEHGKGRSFYTDASGKVKKSGVKYSAAERAEIQRKVEWWKKQLREIEQRENFQKILKREKAKMAERHAKEVADIRAKYDQRLSDLRAKRDEKVEAEKQKMRDYKQFQRDSKEYKALKSKLEADVKWLDERLRHPTDAKHIPEEFKKGVSAFLLSLDFESEYTDRYEVRNGRPSQKVIDLRAMREVYEKILKDQSSTMELDEIQLEALKELEKICANKRVADLDYAELGLVRDAIQYIKMSVTVADKAFNKEIKESISSMGEALIQEQRSKKTRKDHTGIVGGADKLLNFDNVAPADKFHEFGGVMEKLYHEIRKGFDSHISNVQSAIAYTQNLIKGKEEAIKEWSGKKAKTTKFQISDGTTIELTPAQVMSLYCLMKREQALGHIIGSGIVPSGVEVKDNKRIGKVNLPATKKLYSDRASRCTLEDIQKIVSTLTADQKRVADGVAKFFTTKCADWGNETSMKLYGYKKFNEANYFPIKSSDAYLNARFDDSGDVLIKNLGFTKNTVVNANNPIVIEDIFDVLADHTNKMSMYNALVVPLTDFTRVFNYKSKASDNTIYDSVQKALEASGGNLGIQYIKQFMKDINKQANSLAAESFINQSISRYKKAKIAASARVLLQQPTAITRAAAMVDPKYLIKGLQQKANYEEMFDHSEIAYWKSLGFYQTDMGRNMKDILLDNESALDRMTMGVYGKADDFAWGHLWNAVKLEQADAHPDMDTTSSEFLNLVAERFDEVVDRTQVVDSVFHRSQIMRAQGAATKVATAFMSEPTKAFNLLRTDLIDSIDSKDYSKIKRSVVTYVANAVLVAAFAGIADMIRDDEDEDDEGEKRSLWDKYRDSLIEWDDSRKIFKLKGNIVSNINPLGMIPYAKELSSMIQGYDVNRMEMASLAEFVKTAKKWTQGKYSYPYLIKETAEDISELFGIPVKNALRDIFSLVRTAGNIVGGYYYEAYMVDKMKYNISNSANRSVFYKHYTDALLAGDEAAADKILMDMVINGIPYDNIISKGYQAEKDVAFSEARKLIATGKADEAKSLIKKLAKKYGKKYTTLWKAVKNGDSADVPEETYDFKDLSSAVRKGEDTELIEEYLTEYGGYSEEDLEEAIKLLTEKYK